LGNTAWDVTYVDGATKITFLYMMLNTASTVLRMLVI
jgi:hypothetical protein